MPDSLVPGSLGVLLRDITSLLERQRVVEALVARQQAANKEILQKMTDRQHQAEIQSRLAAAHPADVAYVLESLPLEERLRVWSQAQQQQGGAILLELSNAIRKSVLDSMPAEDVLAVLRQVAADDLPELTEEIPKEILDHIYSSLDSQAQEWVVSSISYADDSVGQLMTRNVLTTRPDRSLSEMVEDLRGKELPHHLDSLYVIDSRHTLLGELTTKQILLSDPKSLAREIMTPSPATFSPHQSAPEVAKAFERYDLLSAPVVDERDKLLGRLTVESVMDYVRQKADEEALRRAGLRGEEDIFAPVWASAKNRWLWLGVNLVTAFIASRVIGLFEQTIAHLVALAALMPIVASIGGNTGNQTVALIVRALATNHLPQENTIHLLWKEIRVATLNGLVWGGFMGCLTLLLYRNLLLGVVMCASMLLNLLVAAIVGVLVPLILDRFGYDPAQGSSVLLTFTTDSMGFLIFLGLASAVLH